MPSYLDIVGLTHYNSELKRYYSRMNDGGTLIPQYIGDYITYRGLPSCVVNVGSMFYAIDSYNVYGDQGHLYVFDNDTNTRVTASEKELLCGHANSMCYNANNNRFYIAPAFTYDGNNDPQVTNDIYVYSNDFTYIGSIVAPEQIMGVSFDHVKSKMYAFGYSGELYLFDENGGTFSNYCTVGRPLVFNQDIAIYNDFLFLSGSESSVNIYCIQDGTCSLLNSKRVADFDVSNLLQLGELEGWEFNADGHLFALDYVNLYNDSGYIERAAYVVEIPAGFVNMLPDNKKEYGITNRFMHAASSFESKFSLRYYQVRTVNQYMSLRTYSDTLFIDDHLVEPVNIIITKNCKIYIDGTLECVLIQNFANSFVLGCETNGGRLVATTSTAQPIILRRSGTFFLAGRYSLSVSTPNTNTVNFVWIQNDTPLALFHKVPSSVQGITLRISGIVITEDSVFFGETKLH